MGLRVSAICLILAACQQTNDITVFEGATIFDGRGSTITGAVITVQAGRILEVGPAGQVNAPSGAARIDLRGKWVIPGLIDAHVHIAEWMFPRLVAWGVTTVRDMHNDSVTAARVADLANLRGDATPRVLTSGAAIDGPGSVLEGATIAADANAGRRAVGARAIAGVAWIKLYTHITPSLLNATGCR